MIGRSTFITKGMRQQPGRVAVGVAAADAVGAEEGIKTPEVQLAAEPVRNALGAVEGVHHEAPELQQLQLRQLVAERPAHAQRIVGVAHLHPAAHQPEGVPRRAALLLAALGDDPLSHGIDERML